MPSIFRDPLTVTDLSTGETLDLQSGGPSSASGFITDILEGWNDTPGVSSTIIARGNGDGARRGSRWSDKEKYMTIGGAAYAWGDRDGAEVLRDTLFGMFQPRKELALDRQVGSTRRRVFVSTYDSISCDDPVTDGFRYTIPIVALDPAKYAPDPMVAEASAFSGEQWYRTYDWLPT